MSRGRPLTVDQMCVGTDATVAEAIRCIDANRLGVAFVVEADGRLVGSVTDGDVRRAILDGNLNLDLPAAQVMNPKPNVLKVGAGAEETYVALSTGVQGGRRVFPRVDDAGVIHSFSYREDWGLIPIAEPQLVGNETKYVLECLESNWISSTGPFVARFEEAFAEFTGLEHPIAVSNGTTALTLAMQALSLPAGAEVIVPDFTFAATANAVIAAGGVPVLADIDAATWGLSPATVAPLFNERTWGVIAVHMYGNPCDVAALSEMCDVRGLVLIEDCAEAIGTTAAGRHVGGFGAAAAFSFFGNKTLTTGEGGMVFFSNAQDAEHARVLKDHGMSKTRRYWHDEVGYNYRLTNLQAAIGVAQCERATELVASKYRNADAYIQGLADTDIFVPMAPSALGTCSYWLMPILISAASGLTRDFVMEYLAQRGIQTRITFPSLHQMPAFAGFPQTAMLPQSIDVAARGICLPNNPQMTPEDVQHVVTTLLECASAKR